MSTDILGRESFVSHMQGSLAEQTQTAAENTLHDKGIDLDNEVRIYDVCNPLAASQAMHQDMATATVLPCRIAVYSNAGGSTIATVKPTDLFAATGLRHAR